MSSGPERTRDSIGRGTECCGTRRSRFYFIKIRTPPVLHPAEMHRAWFTDNPGKGTSFVQRVPGGFVCTGGVVPDPAEGEGGLPEERGGWVPLRT